jgi:predicted Zn-ribbon and HTH transcriptional regulator
MTIMVRSRRKTQDQGSFKRAKDKKSRKIVPSKISRFASGFAIPNDAKSKCPKCSSDMIRHPSLASMHLSSSPEVTL